MGGYENVNEGIAELQVPGCHFEAGCRSNQGPYLRFESVLVHVSGVR